MPGIGVGIAKCPYDPQDNSTAVYVENGNPGGLPALVCIDMQKNVKPYYIQGYKRNSLK